MKKLLIVSAVILCMNFESCSQDANENSSPQNSAPYNPAQNVGGSCEGCEAIYEQAPPFEKLSWIDTLPDFNESGPKMVISGVVYQRDGKTPVKDVVLYIYHTDQTGHYTPKPGQTGWAKRNGYIRGWMKTNEKGEYKFYTLKPASYPGTNIPAHIHPILKEPNKNEYWIDEYLFDDDPFLTTSERNKQEKRGGSGIIKLVQKDGMLYGERNILLGFNVPNYPTASKTSLQSGLAIGDNGPAMDPYHITGPDRGTRTCPMCKYGRGQGVMVWWNDKNIEPFMQMMKSFDDKIKEEGFNKLRVFGVYMNPNKESNQRVTQQMQRWIDIYGLNYVAIVCIPSPGDLKTAGLFHINPSPEIQNTILVYKKRIIADKFVNYDTANDDLAPLLSKLL